MDQALARTWVWACRSEGPRRTAAACLLFAADRRLARPAVGPTAVRPSAAPLAHRDLTPGPPRGPPSTSSRARRFGLLGPACSGPGSTAAAGGCWVHRPRRPLTKRDTGDGGGGAFGADGSAACGEAVAAPAAMEVALRAAVEGLAGGGGSCGGGGSWGGSLTATLALCLFTFRHQPQAAAARNSPTP